MNNSLTPSLLQFSVELHTALSINKFPLSSNSSTVTQSVMVGFHKISFSSVQSGHNKPRPKKLRNVQQRTNVRLTKSPLLQGRVDYYYYYCWTPLKDSSRARIYPSLCHVPPNPVHLPFRHGSRFLLGTLYSCLCCISFPADDRRRRADTFCPFCTSTNRSL